ncbi:MAG TPA: hypothetical protein VHO70_07605 [Chitinispirillaceae bacterium]|nr:hypothetical protein [Chitinispirillaceae bacterium]
MASDAVSGQNSEPVEFANVADLPLSHDAIVTAPLLWELMDVIMKMHLSQK